MVRYAFNQRLSTFYQSFVSAIIANVYREGKHICFIIENFILSVKMTNEKNQPVANVTEFSNNPEIKY